MGILAAFAVPHPPLLIPDVGDESKPEVQKTREAYERVARESAALQPETLIIFSPHATSYFDYFHISPGTEAHGDFASFGASQRSFSVEYDTELIAKLTQVLQERNIPGGTEGDRSPTLDHGTMVPLYFFGKATGDEGGAGKGVKVVRIGLSGLSLDMHRRFGSAVAHAAKIAHRKVVIIASGDLSHRLLASGPYGFAPEGPEFDKLLCAALATGNVVSMLAINEQISEGAAECGLRSFVMMGGALEDFSFKPQLLSYEGPFGVGYAVASYLVEASEDLQGESLPVALARKTLESFFEAGCKRPTLDTPGIKELLASFEDRSDTKQVYEDLLHTQAGAFVSLYKNGELRGCIGTIAPTRENVLAEIAQNAVSAAREDPRFPAVEASELPQLSVKVDILGEAEPVTDRSTLDAQRYGVIVSLGYRRGLLLPALEGVDTPDEQIAIALSKAGIRADEPYELERFEVVRYA